MLVTVIIKCSLFEREIRIVVWIELSSLPPGASVNAWWTQNCRMLCEVNINRGHAMAQKRQPARERLHWRGQADALSSEAWGWSPRTRGEEREEWSKSYGIAEKCRTWTLDLMEWRTWQLLCEKGSKISVRVSGRRKMDDLRGVSPLWSGQNDEQGWFIDTERLNYKCYINQLEGCI